MVTFIISFVIRVYVKVLVVMIKELLEKFAQGKCSPDELELLESLMSSEEMNALDDTLLKTWNDDNYDSSVGVEKDDIWRKISLKVDRDEKRRALRIKRLSYTTVASVFAIFCVVLFSKTILANTITTTTNNGEDPMLLELEDKTKVWLKKGASISYKESFDSSERVVEFDGEGYFDVSHNADKPFKVIHNEMETIVLGTEFNINTGQESDSKVSLFKGSVRVLQHEGEWLLKPGEQLKQSSDAAGLELVNFDLDTNNILAWKIQKFVFNNRPLIEVIETMEKHYQVKMDYDEAQLIDKKITCDVDFNQNLDNTLEILLFPHQLKYTKETKDEKIIII